MQGCNFVIVLSNIKFGLAISEEMFCNQLLKDEQTDWRMDDGQRPIRKADSINSGAQVS